MLYNLIVGGRGRWWVDTYSHWRLGKLAVPSEELSIVVSLKVVSVFFSPMYPPDMDTNCMTMMRRKS